MRPRARAVCNRARNVPLGQTDRLDQGFALRTIRRNGGRVRASRAVRRHPAHKRRPQKQFSFAIVKNVQGFLRAFKMAALQQNGAAKPRMQFARSTPQILGLANRRIRQHFSFRNIRRDKIRQRQEPGAERFDRRFLKQQRPARGDHDRIHDQRAFDSLRPQKCRDGINDSRRKQHAGLDCMWRQLGEHRFELKCDKLRRGRLHAQHTLRILRRKTSDRGGAVHLERGERLEISLDPCATAAVGPRDSERTR